MKNFLIGLLSMICLSSCAELPQHVYVQEHHPVVVHIPTPPRHHRIIVRTRPPQPHHDMMPMRPPQQSQRGHHQNYHDFRQKR